MRTLNSITIRGYKSIRELDRLILSQLNILIGANGAGKSNFISLFKLLNQLVSKRLQVFVAQSGGANSLMHHGRKATNEIQINLGFADNGYEVKLEPTVNDNLIISDEQCRYFNPIGKRYNIHLGRGTKETTLDEAAKTKPIAEYVFNDLSDWKVYHFHDTSDGASVKRTGDINDNAILRPDAENLAAFLYLLKTNHQAHYERIVDTIRLAAPFFDDFILRPRPDNPNKIRLEWSELGVDTYLDASSLSDGTLRFICLATLLLQPNLPTVVLIDEPELGLHPSAIVLLTEMLRSAAVRSQVIVSTQSVPLVNQVSPEDVIVVEREDNQSVFRRLNFLDLEEWLEEYSLGELWEKNVLGGRP